jgi:arylsulfatase A-like enzyme
MNAICLVLDRLHVGYVGAYGNSWIATPALDRLASQAFVFDQALVDSPRLESLYRSYWQGWHALCPAQPPTGRPALAALLREAGVRTTLISDERAVARHPLALEFDELVEIDPPWQARPAEQLDETHLARCFVHLIDWLPTARPPFLLWCHLASLGTIWDAPPEYRLAYWEEGDPPPPNSAEVPDLMLPEDHDPDQLFGLSQAYAGQVSLLDTCLGALLGVIDEGPASQDTLLALVSARGYPLGEHRRVGPCDRALYSELVHVPFVLRFSDLSGAAARSQALVEPADLWATLLDWCNIADPPASPSAASLLPLVRQQVAAVRDRLCITGGDTDQAIRTPAWYLRACAGGCPTPTTPELFAKPDDRWDVNNVSDRCHEVVEFLQQALDQYQRTLQTGPVTDLPPLSEVLLSGL